MIVFGFVRIASQMRSAASSGVIVGNASYIFVGAIIGVRTSCMWIVVKWTLSPIVSVATTRVHASSAAFDATYALKRGGFVCAPIELIWMTWPALRSVMCGSRFIVRRIAPK